MEFPRQEYWSGLPFPSPGDLPNLGIEPGSLHCRQTLYCLSHQGSQLLLGVFNLNESQLENLNFVIYVTNVMNL